MTSFPKKPSNSSSLLRMAPVRNYERLLSSSLILEGYSKKAAEIIHIEENPETKPAIKKSSLRPDEPMPVRAVKKSSIPMEDTIEVRTTPLGISRSQSEKPSKFGKLEKNDKIIRSKKPETQLDKLSSLVKMRQKFFSKKNNDKAEDSEDTKEHHDKKNEKNLRFVYPIQNLTGICIKGDLKTLEGKFKEFLRKNTKAGFNAYEFADKTETVECFGCEEIKYSEIFDFVSRNVVHND